MSSQPFNPFDMLNTPWGKLPLGGATSAAATIEELDKRITELKTVEQWLSLNLNLLKTTIQGLEVQRATLAAIEALTSSFAQGTTPGGKEKPSSVPPNPFATPAKDGSAPPAGMEQAAWWWNSMQDQFGQMLAATQAGAQAMVTPNPASAGTPKKTSDKAASQTSGTKKT